MNDTDWIAMWVRHCRPVVLFVHYKPSGYQYVFMPLLADECDECGLRH